MASVGIQAFRSVLVTGRYFVLRAVDLHADTAETFFQLNSFYLFKVITNNY